MPDHASDQVEVTRGDRLFNKNIANCCPVMACTVREAFPLLVTEARFQPGEGPVKGGGNCDLLKVAKYLAE